MRRVDFWSFLRESANPFLNLCSEFDNPIIRKVDNDKGDF